jgi:hypothetical protein
MFHKCGKYYYQYINYHLLKWGHPPWILSDLILSLCDWEPYNMVFSNLGRNISYPVWGFRDCGVPFLQANALSIPQIRTKAVFFYILSDSLFNKLFDFRCCIISNRPNKSIVNLCGINWSWRNLGLCSICLDRRKKTTITCIAIGGLRA